MKLSSPAFEHGERIPSRFTCDGANHAPPLQISDVPPGAKSLVLIMDDPDVPTVLRSDGMWDHWVVFNIPVGTTEIREGEEPDGVHGKGTGGNLAYFGPCPPDREHRYFFKVYALDAELDLPEGATKQEVENALENHLLAKAELMGRYQRGFVKTGIFKILMTIRRLFSGRRMSSAVLLAALCGAAFLSPALAQEEEATASETTLAQELTKLNQTMREITELMRTYIARQEVDMIMKRIELHRRYLTPLEEELRRAKSTQENVEEELERMSVIIAEMEEELERDDSDGLDPADGRAQQAVDRMELHLKLQKDRRWTLEQRIIELENDLTGRRQEMEALEEIADEQLGLR
ncbi:MAG: YbhB/YbcL family Raf kinase inhibitor-like protein [bacterium]|nr:YbhB/YbcL family Raf kinase inhibitor-like protein [bacterium]